MLNIWISELEAEPRHPTKHIILYAEVNEAGFTSNSNAMLTFKGVVYHIVHAIYIYIYIEHEVIWLTCTSTVL